MNDEEAARLHAAVEAGEAIGEADRLRLAERIRRRLAAEPDTPAARRLRDYLDWIEGMMGRGG